MGAAAYNRGSNVIANQIARDFPVKPAAFAIMDRINDLPKFKGDLRSQILDLKRHPFTRTVAIEFRRGVWWMMDPQNMYEGYSFWYRSLEDLIRSWDIYLTAFDETTGIWTATAI